MPVSQLPQAPYRQDRAVFPTPLTTDVLFSEVRDCTRASFPAYGTPHPNAAKWPNHKLIFIKTVDIERDGIFEFYYAADRETQDLYNFASGYRNVIGNVGGREFRVVLREYVTLRSDFDPMYPAFATPMPDVPSGTFEGIEYVFFDKQQKKMDQVELDSLYVAEVRTYVERAFLDYKISYTAQVPDLVPDKFRAALTRTTIEGIEEGTAELPTLLDGQLVSSQDQLNPDVKLVKTVTQNNPSSNVVLTGTRSYVETTKADTVETFSTSQLEAETGLLIAQSVVTPLGNGDFVRETVKVDAWPALVSSQWDPTINAQIKSTEQFISPDDVDFTAQNTSYRAVNKDRTLRTVETTPADALANYLLSFPSRMDVQLPQILKSISVVWSSESAQGSSDGEWNGFASGQSYSLGGSEGDDCQSSASIRPELVIDIEQPWGSDIPVTVHAFFIETANGSVTEGSLKARIEQVIGSATQNWPTFKPVSHTMITQGGKVGVLAGASGNAAVTKSQSTNSAEKGTTRTTKYDVSLNTSSTNIGPTIHKDLVIESYTRSISASATARAYWVGTNFPSVDVSSTASKSITAEVSPRFLAATTPNDIPRSGKHIMRTTVEPYKWGWAKCTAVILDASYFQ